MVKKSEFVLVGAVLGGMAFSQPLFAQSSPLNDRVNGGQAIQIKQDPKTIDAKPGVARRNPTGTHKGRLRHHVFLAPRR